MSVSHLQKTNLEKVMSEMLYALCQGNLDEVSKKISHLKRLSGHFSQKIQTDVQALIVQVEVQKDYIPQHGITPTIQKLADKLIKDLKK